LAELRSLFSVRFLEKKVNWRRLMGRASFCTHLSAVSLGSGHWDRADSLIQQGGGPPGRGGGGDMADAGLAALAGQVRGAFAAHGRRTEHLHPAIKLDGGSGAAIGDRRREAVDAAEAWRRRYRRKRESRRGQQLGSSRL
jgi:hypothetical protein